MPRTGRIHAPGVLHHVMVRGIERGPIFQDDEDRMSFRNRMEQVLEEERVVCYAWSFMGNHAHLLLRPTGKSISRPLQRILTGYVGYYNRRHRRWGHLFQNRFKSIVVEEEPYFLELVRYVHLNPARVGVVGTLGELDAYPWSGHALIVKGADLPWMGVTEVLSQFGSEVKRSIMRYREFMEAGWDQGRKPELVGGGLIRSFGGWEAVKNLRRRKGEDRVACDARILGQGDFVETMLRESGQELSRREGYRRKGIDLQELTTRVARYFGISSSVIRGGGKLRRVSEARSLLIWMAIMELGYTGIQVAQWLGISPSAVSKGLNQVRLRREKGGVSKIFKEILKTS